MPKIKYNNTSSCMNLYSIKLYQLYLTLPNSILSNCINNTNLSLKTNFLKKYQIKNNVYTDGKYWYNATSKGKIGIVSKVCSKVYNWKFYKQYIKTKIKYI